MTDRHPRSGLVPVIAMLLAVALSPAACAMPADDAAIRDLGRAWVDAYRSGDIEAFMASYTDDAILALAGRSALRGKAEIRAFFAPRIAEMAARHVDVAMKFERLRVVGDMAYSITLNWVMTHPEQGQPYRAGARSILVYRRVPSQGWKMDADIEQRTPDADVSEIPPSDLSP